MHKQILSGTLLVAALALSSLSATAGVIIYSSVTNPGQYPTDTDALNAWTSAGTVGGTITFTGVNLVNFSTYTQGPLTFSSTNGNLLNTHNDGFGPGSGTYLVNFSPTNITTDGTVFGIAFNFRCYSCDPATATFTLTPLTGSPSSFNVLTSSTGISNFFGVRSDVAIQSLQISFGTGNFVALDNVGFGGTSGGDTPEATTLVLIGTGLALIARYRRFACQPPTA